MAAGSCSTFTTIIASSELMLAISNSDTSPTANNWPSGFSVHTADSGSIVAVKRPIRTVVSLPTSVTTPATICPWLNGSIQSSEWNS